MINEERKKQNAEMIIRRGKKAVQVNISYRKLFATDEGQIVLSDLMRTHWMMGSTFVPGKPDEVALREGERNVVLRILKMLRTDPEEMRAKIERTADDYK